MSIFENLNAKKKTARSITSYVNQGNARNILSIFTDIGFSDEGGIVKCEKKNPCSGIRVVPSHLARTVVSGNSELFIVSTMHDFQLFMFGFQNNNGDVQ